jgi:hypothetical protein
MRCLEGSEFSFMKFSESQFMLIELLIENLLMTIFTVIDSCILLILGGLSSVMILWNFILIEILVMGCLRQIRISF